MCLRFSRTLITGTVLAVSLLAHAKTPLKTTSKPVSASSAGTASALAQVQAIFSYCELVDPHSSAKYQKFRNVVL